jgi:molybdopterin converting factor small subunit
MAIIREKTQYSIGPIGVARASRGGQVLGETISDAARQAQSYYYRRAVEDAQKAGAEAAGSLEATKVTELDPETGRPKVYEGPKGFGRYAQQAYQKVLMQRFEQEIGLEIEDKSKELAIKFSKSPEAFNTAMSDYIAEMSNVEESTVFKQEIQRIGKAVQNSKYRALQAQAAARQERNDKIGYVFSSDKSLEAIEDVAATGNFDAAKVLIKQSEQLDADNIAAGTILPNETLANPKKRKQAYARGVFRNELTSYLKTEADSYDLQNALNGLDSGDLSLIPSGILTETKKILSREGAVFTEDLASYGMELLEDGINQVRLKREIESRNRAATALEFEAENIKSYIDLLGASSSQIQSSLSSAVSNYSADYQKGIDAYRNGASQQEVLTYTSQSSAALQQQANALTRQIFGSVDTVADVNAIQTYLTNPTDNNLLKLKSPEIQSLAKSLVDADINTNQRLQLVDNANKYAESITDETRVAEANRKLQNSIDVKNFIEDEYTDAVFEATKSSEISDAIKSVMSRINSTELDLEIKDNFKTLISDQASDNFLRLGFSSALTPRVISAMQQYASTGTDKANLLTDEQKAIIDEGRKLSKSRSRFAAKLGEFSARATQRYDNATEIVRENKLLNQVLTNAVAYSDIDEKDRLMLDRKLGIPQDFYENPEYKNNPDFAETNMIIEQVSKSYWPQAQYDSIRRFLRGGLMDKAQVERVLSTYANTSTYVSNGFEHTSSALSGLSANEIALMNEAISFGQDNSDVQAMMQHLNQVRNFETNPALKKDMDGFFSQKAEDGVGAKSSNLTEYIVNNFPESQTNARLRNRLISEARVKYFASFTEKTELVIGADVLTGRTSETLSNIDEHLQNIIENEFVSDNQIINMDGTNRTMMPLSRTVPGFEDKFINYIRGNMKRMTTNEDIDWDTVDFKLMPVGYNTKDKGMTYGVILMDGANRNLQEVEIYVSENDPSVVMPAFFSTNEPLFAKVKQNKIDLDKAAALQNVKNVEDVEEILSTDAYDVKTTIQPQNIGPFGPLPNYETSKPADINSLIDVDKYESVFNEREVYFNLYKQLGTSPNAKRLINLLLNEVTEIDDSLANELEVDLKSMLNIIESK